MYIPTISEPRAHGGKIPSTFSVDWNKFDFQVVKFPSSIISGIVENQLLRGTHLSCTISTEAGQWKNRKVFVEKVLADIVIQCPKDEPLVLISFGADRLLIEYILGKSLIENGFCQISFFLVDPLYVFSNPENLKDIKDVLKDFRECIESVYLTTHKEHFTQERIRYLSRSQNIAKSFPDNANVVVIESLPPYGEIIKDMQKSHVKEKKPEDLLTGGRIIPSSHANAVAFIPAQYVKNLNLSGAKLIDSLPLAIFKCVESQSCFYIDWGCKIRSDGTYCLSFSGEENYFKSLGISEDTQVKLTTGEVVRVKQWIPTIRKSIEDKLVEQIESIKGGNSQKQLSQDNLTILLEKIKEIVTLYMPGISCFFLADYVLDQTETMTFISSHASHHYRKIFSLKADTEAGYKITVDEIK